MSSKYPKEVALICNIYDGWIIGGGAIEDNPRDYDVYVPMKYWREVSALIPQDAKINTFGGFKFIREGKEIDIWTGEMSDMFSTAFFKAALHPKSGILIVRDKTSIK